MKNYPNIIESIKINADKTLLFSDDSQDKMIIKEELDSLLGDIIKL